MLAQQIAVKLYAHAAVDQDPLIGIFHEWIRKDRLPEHLLLDVADYRHVPDGPGVMIVGHQAQFGVDEEAPGAGLLYTRRRDEPGELDAKVGEALYWAATVAALLEEHDAYHGAFSANHIRFQIRSRLFSEDVQGAANALAEAVMAVARPLWGDAAKVVGQGDVRRLPEAVLRAPGGTVAKVADLAARLRPG